MSTFELMRDMHTENYGNTDLVSGGDDYFYAGSFDGGADVIGGLLDRLFDGTKKKIAGGCESCGGGCIACGGCESCNIDGGTDKCWFCGAEHYDDDMVVESKYKQGGYTIYTDDSPLMYDTKSKGTDGVPEESNYSYEESYNIPAEYNIPKDTYDMVVESNYSYEESKGIADVPEESNYANEESKGIDEDSTTGGRGTCIKQSKYSDVHAFIKKYINSIDKTFKVNN